MNGDILQNYQKIELTLKNGDLETAVEFSGILLGEASFIDREQKDLPKELIKIFKREDGKYVSYMEYSDTKEGIWESKMCVTQDLDLLEIRKGLTRNSYHFGNLDIQNVPSEILGLATFRAAEKILDSNL